MLLGAAAAVTTDDGVAAGWLLVTTLAVALAFAAAFELELLLTLGTGVLFELLVVVPQLILVGVCPLAVYGLVEPGFICPCKSPAVLILPMLQGSIQPSR